MDFDKAFDLIKRYDAAHQRLFEYDSGTVAAASEAYAAVHQELLDALRSAS